MPLPSYQGAERRTELARPPLSAVPAAAQPSVLAVEALLAERGPVERRSSLPVRSAQYAATSAPVEQPRLKYVHMTGAVSLMSASARGCPMVCRRRQRSKGGYR